MPEVATPDDDAALKRLRMRAWRRGIREMDLILGPFADEVLPGLAAPERARFEALLSENDHDLYQWLTARIAGKGGAAPLAGPLGPQNLAPLLDRIAAHATLGLARS